MKIIVIWTKLKFAYTGPIDNMPASVQVIAWCRTSNKLLSESTVAYFTELHACVKEIKIKQLYKNMVNNFHQATRCSMLTHYGPTASSASWPYGAAWPMARVYLFARPHVASEHAMVFFPMISGELLSQQPWEVLDCGRVHIFNH